MADKVFAKGIRTFAKKDSQPDFVLGELVITPNELFAWLKGEGAQYLTEYKDVKQLKLQVTKSRDGGLMLAVNTYKKDAQPQESYANASTSSAKKDEDSLPF